MIDPIRDKLRADPRQKALADAYQEASTRWHTHYLHGTHPCTWLPWLESLAIAWQHALSTLDPEAPNMNERIQASIDAFIYDHLADINKSPARLDRGAKHRQRSTVKGIKTDGFESDRIKTTRQRLDETEDAEEEARLGWIRQRLEAHAAKTQWIIDRIKEPKLKLAVEMARDYMPPAAIREKTNLRIPDLQEGWDKWCFILRVAA